MLLSTFRKLFRLIICKSPIKANTNIRPTGIKPNQSVRVYRGMWTPVILWIKRLSVEKPTVELQGPIALVSTKQRSVVQRINATRKRSAGKSFFLFSFFICKNLSFLYLTCVWKYFMFAFGFIRIPLRLHSSCRFATSSRMLLFSLFLAFSGTFSHLWFRLLYSHRLFRHA